MFCEGRGNRQEYPTIHVYTSVNIDTRLRQPNATVCKAKGGMTELKDLGKHKANIEGQLSYQGEGGVHGRFIKERHVQSHKPKATTAGQDMSRRDGSIGWTAVG